MKKRKNIIFMLSAVACLLAVSCEKVEIETTLLIDSKVQYDDKGEETPNKYIKGYLFYADTARWAVMSYEDALNGVLRSKADPTQEKYFDLQSAVTAASTDYFHQIEFGPIQELNFILVLCFTDNNPRLKNKLYGWRAMGTAKNLPLLHIPFTFTPWKEERDYKWSTYWNMVDESVIPPEEEDDDEEENGGGE